MKARATFLAAVLLASCGLGASRAWAQFATPLYINMGGAQITDSQGRTWLGDGAGADPLNIRPNDAGGANILSPGQWCEPTAGSLSALGFNPAAADRDIFRSIRWDTGGDGIPYVLEIPVAPGTYDVDLYFCEACCPFRHVSIDIQGATVFPDVSSNLYAGGANNVVGRLTTCNVVVDASGILNITLFECLDPLCPGGTDGNGTLSALSVVPAGFSPPCPSGLTCSVDDGTGDVTGTWQAPPCNLPAGYEVYQEGVLVATLPGTATSFTVNQAAKIAHYRLVTVGGGCGELTCTATRASVPFAVPLRINMGGAETVDSRGRLWFGDGPGAGDPLSIRPDDAGGANFIENWCTSAVLANADALGALGLDASNPSDMYIMSTIRWDNGGDAIDYRLELPVPNGAYLVNLYFTECCCTFRHFKLELQGAIVNDDVSAADYSASGTPGRTGVLGFDNVLVTDGLLRIGLLPCPQCPPVMGVDTNAILNAIEVLEAGNLVPICPRDLRCSMSPTGVVTGTWSAAQNVAIGGYELRRNGDAVALLDAAATQFTDSPPCRRATTYEVVPLAPGGGPACPDLRLLCTIVQPDCPFEAPLRINMGGLQMVDSQGRVWLGDPGEGADVLNLRPNDTSGSHAIEYFSGNQGNDSFPPLGLDPNSLADRYIFNTIRWNQLDLAPSFRMEIPLDIAVYKVDMYFNEGCCPQRHFKIALQDSVVQSDVSNPIPGRVRRDSFSDIHVTNTLKIELTPCLDPECPGGGDPNPIVNAIEIVATGEHPTLQLAGDCTQDGTRDLGDVICMIGHQFPGFFLLTRTRPSLPCVGEPASGPGNGVVLDVNNDTRFDVSDIVSLAQYAVMGSPPPALGLDCLIPASSLGCFNPACY